MKTSKLVIALVVTLLLLSLAACGGKKSTGPTPDGVIVYRPAWWFSQTDEAYVCTYGQSTKVSETASMDAAKANALLEAAQFVETEVKGMIKNYEEEAGVKDPQVLALSQSVVKAVSNARFSGVMPGLMETRMVQEEGGRRYRTWIQMKIPKKEVNKNLANQIRNEEALYNQFKASQAFQELEAATK